MISESISPQLLVSESDLLRCAAIVEERFQDAAQEAARLEITRRMLGAAFTVERALRIQTRCALVNHCGTHGTSNLADASAMLFEALRAYARLVREIAARYRNYTGDGSAGQDGRVVLEVA